MTFRVVAPPVTEPISLTLARTHLRLVPDDDSPPAHPDDAWITEIGIPAAREFCESELGRAIGQQTVEILQDSFTEPILLPYGPVISVTSVTYLDEDEVETTLSASLYVVDVYGGRIGLATDAEWPTTASVLNAVRVRYVAGYTLADDSPNDRPLPAKTKAAMLLVLGHLYENREETTDLKLENLPLGVQALLVSDQLRMSMA